MTSGQDGDVFPGMALRRRDVGDVTVPILEVVPMHEVAPHVRASSRPAKPCTGKLGRYLLVAKSPSLDNHSQETRQPRLPILRSCACMSNTPSLI